MSTKTTEHNKLIATRVPPGDKWKDVRAGDSSPIIMESLTEALNDFFMS